MIISKFLTNRLTPYMHTLVDPTQAAFIKGRYTLYNIVAANEVIHYAKTFKQKGIVLKIDFKKAYDKVSWSFLEKLLLSRGFGIQWTTWILNLLQGSQTCVNFNGTPTHFFFFCKRGLRLGDPLSQFLFDLVTDALCQILNRDKILGLIQGLGPVLDDGHRIIIFHYADDTVFFCKQITLMWKL